jgi:RNA polymerase sigma-70 factor (ECF subfamily)
LAKRAREHLKAARPRYQLPKEHGFEIAEAFFAASHDGDMAALQALLTDDIAIYADGGGKRPAALVPLFGIERAMLLYKRIAGLLVDAPRPHPSLRMIDGLPGYVTVEVDGVPQTTAFDIRDGKIAAIYIVRNPDKLRHLDKSMLQ